MPSGSLTCSGCGRTNPSENRFCGGCGAELARTCPSCGRANPPDHAFCGGCGHGLGAESSAAAPSEDLSREPRAYTPKHLVERILTSRSAIEGERKHVTVMFADVVASTELAERSDPEHMHALMDRYIRLILDQVHRYEGTVNQFLGDGVMALFGAPVALEGAPRRALMAALGIQRGLASLREELAAEGRGDFRMRIGIHSGPVVVGKIGDDLRMDYTAVGDTTNLADRLQKLAVPGAILISEATEHLVSGFFEVRDLGHVGVKGKSEPVHAYEVVGERAASGRIEAAAERGLTPFVGREREIEALWAAFESARAGRGQVAFVVGEAGIGKSRLHYEFRRRLEGEPHTWFEGGCKSYGQTTAFQPIVDGLRQGFAVEDRDDDAAAAAKVERGVRALGADLDWTLPALRQLLSLPVEGEAVAAMDAVTRRSETIRSLQALFRRAAEREPLVFVIEDLHWIDAASEEFVGLLADSIPGTRALMLLTHRPGYRHPFGDRSYHARIALQALSESEMSSMAGALLEAPDLPQALRRLIARKAEGNPFFVEEVTKSLLEEGVLRLEEGRVELSRDLEQIAVPDSLWDVIMARIDRLPDEPKRAIQVASVIGREFALRLLERISEVGDRMGTVVDELRALELILETTAYPELAFMFKHALTRDVAYDSVLVQRRKALHRIVGSAVEELYRDRLAEHYEVLAHHFSRGEDWERALLYHERASEKAAATYANHSAAEHCRQALAIALRLGERVTDERRRALEERLGEVSFCISDLLTSGEAYLRAAQLSPEPSERAMSLARASWSFIWGHLYSHARDAASEALSLGRKHELPAVQSLALATRHVQYATEHGPPPPERDLLAEARRLAERSASPEALVRALSQQALVADWRGDYRESLELSERALAVAGDHVTYDTIYARWTLGLSAACLGQYGRALAVFREGLERCDRIGDRALKTRLLNTLGWCHGELGCHVHASRFNEQATALGRELVELGLVAGAPELHANAAINLAANRVALGDPDGALELLEPIQSYLEQPGDPWQRWRYSLHARDALARHALACGEAERALALIDEELRGARDHRSSKLEARALELRGRALVAMDRRDEAREALHGALEVARRIEYPPVVWRALSLQGELARRSGDGSEAERLAARARELVENLAAPLPEAALRHEFGALAERLVSDPLGAYR